MRWQHAAPVSAGWPGNPGGSQSATTDGSGLASGICFARLVAGDQVQLHRMVLVE